MNKVRLPEHNTGPVEEDPEYRLIVQSNNLAVELDHEISLVHKVYFPVGMLECMIEWVASSSFEITMHQSFPN
jgi:hypothetical protein